MKKLIISLAINGRDAYEEIQKGLIETLPIAGEDCEHWILNHYPEGVTPHNVVPYLFKFDLIKKAVDNEFVKIIWADSTMRLLQDPFGLLDKCDKGILAFENIGHPAHLYTCDKAAENLKDTYKDQEEFESVLQTWGGFIGFDFSKTLPWMIMEELLHQASIGTFDSGTSARENFVAARNDQTTMSFLFHHYKVPLLEYGIIAARQHVTEKTVVQYGD